ncbi:MAG: FAD-binding protein [Pseudomonadota bacterium]
MEKLTTDILIVGGGLAAMMAAWEASAYPLSILMVSKGKVGNSGATLMAGSNFAAVLPEAQEQGDSIAFHIEDTLLGGAGINDPNLVRILAQNAPADLLLLEKLGVRFLKKKERFDIRKPPGHRNPRTVFTQNSGVPMTIRGRTITAPLLQILLQKKIPFLEGVNILRLTTQEGRLTGAIALDRKSGEMITIECQAAIIASGGAGHLYEINTNPGDLTGNSYSLALESGCTLRDMEFVQFYPCLHLGSPRVPIYSPILSDGAVLRNKQGDRFLAKYEPDRMESATRDVVSRAIYREIQEGRGIEGGVYLDLTPIPADLLHFRFPDLLKLFQHHGIDLQKQWIRVAPAAHFFMGGVVIDEHCQTSIPGLFAAGEATGGVQGANRLSGNGLSEPLVFGRIAGREAARYAQEQRKASAPPQAFSSDWIKGERIPDEKIAQTRKKIKKLMWEEVGIIRHGVGLTRALQELEVLQRCFAQGQPASKVSLGNYFEVRSMLTAAIAVVSSAVFRSESRGAHFREDFPASNPEMAKSIYLKLDQGRMRLSFSHGS